MDAMAFSPERRDISQKYAPVCSVCTRTASTRPITDRALSTDTVPLAIWKRRCGAEPSVTIASPFE